MSYLTIDVHAQAKVDVVDIAEQFSKMDSHQQAEFLNELFESLNVECQKREKYQLQLCWIAKGINLKNYKHLIDSIDSLKEFLKEEE